MPLDRCLASFVVSETSVSFERHAFCLLIASGCPLENESSLITRPGVVSKTSFTMPGLAASFCFSFSELVRLDCRFYCDLILLFLFLFAANILTIVRLFDGTCADDY